MNTYIYSHGENLVPAIRTANGWSQGYRNSSGNKVNLNNNGEWLSPKIELPQNRVVFIKIKNVNIPSPSGSIYWWNGDTYVGQSSYSDYSGQTINVPNTTITHFDFAFRAGSDNKEESAIIANDIEAFVYNSNTLGWHNGTSYKYAHGADLFDEDTNNVTAGKYINSEGVEKTSSGSGNVKLNHTDYMPVTPGHQYKYKWSGPIISTSTTVSIILYDEDYEFISRPVSQAITGGSFELDLNSVPNNAAYAILNFPSATWPNSDVSIEFYDKATSWQDGAAHSYNKKQFDLTGTNTDNGYVNSYYLKANGSENLSDTGTWAITEYQEIPSGVSKIIITTNGNTNAAICLYDNSKTFVSGQSYSSSGSQLLNLPTRVKYFRMSIKKDESGRFSAQGGPATWT